MINNYRVVLGYLRKVSGPRIHLNFDEIYGKHIKVTDADGDPTREGFFSIVTPLNGKSWEWRERPEYKEFVKEHLNEPGFLMEHKYNQILCSMGLLRKEDLDPSDLLAD